MPVPWLTAKASAQSLGCFAADCPATFSSHSALRRHVLTADDCLTHHEKVHLLRQLLPPPPQASVGHVGVTALSGPATEAVTLTDESETTAQSQLELGSQSETEPQSSASKRRGSDESDEEPREKLSKSIVRGCAKCSFLAVTPWLVNRHLKAPGACDFVRRSEAKGRAQKPCPVCDAACLGFAGVRSHLAHRHGQAVQELDSEKGGSQASAEELGQASGHAVALPTSAPMIQAQVTASASDVLTVTEDSSLPALRSNRAFRTFGCPKCNFVGFDEYSIRRHGASANACALQLQGRKGGKSRRCLLCPSSTVCNGAMRSHLETAHGVIVELYRREAEQGGAEEAEEDDGVRPTDSEGEASEEEAEEAASQDEESKDGAEGDKPASDETENHSLQLLSEASETEDVTQPVLFQQPPKPETPESQSSETSESGPFEAPIKPVRMLACHRCPFLGRDAKGLERHLSSAKACDYLISGAKAKGRRRHCIVCREEVGDFLQLRRHLDKRHGVTPEVAEGQDKRAQASDGPAGETPAAREPEAVAAGEAPTEPSAETADAALGAAEDQQEVIELPQGADSTQASEDDDSLDDSAEGGEAKEKTTGGAEDKDEEYGEAKVAEDEDGEADATQDEEVAEESEAEEEAPDTTSVAEITIDI